jgi:CRP/FNR family transcriptional regulator, cyclic AMP receptor protein
MSHSRPKPSSSKRIRKLPRAMSPLYGADLFQGIKSAELGTLFDDVELQTCPVGTILFTPEDPCEVLYILREGRVELYRLTASGKRLVTRQILPGSVFGVMGLLGQTMQGNFAETIEDSSICTITREDVLTLLKRRPDIALRMLEIVGSRLRLIEERFLEAVYSSVDVRLAHFLLTYTDSASGELANITHEEIGDTIGVVRQTVTETLGLMRKRGLIQKGPKHIQIIDRHGLEAIARGSES